MHQNRYLLIILSLFIITGCYQKEQAREVPIMGPYDRGNYLITQNKPEYALENLQNTQKSYDKRPESYYNLARAYNFAGQEDKAIENYKKALELNGNYDEAYVVIKEIYRDRLSIITDEIISYKKMRFHASESGSHDLEKIQRELFLKQDQEISIYIGWAEAYLLSQNPVVTLADFSEIDANLREAETILKERCDMTSKEENPSIPETPVYQKIRSLRSFVTQKKINVHIANGQKAREDREWIKAIEELKEADEQIAKFFPQEEIEAEEKPLPKDPGVDKLVEQIYRERINLYQSYIQMKSQSIEAYKNIGAWRDVRDETKVIQEAIERTIEIEREYLWRTKKIPIAEARLHPSMIPHYLDMIKFVPESSKNASYHMLIAKYYFNQKDYKKAWHHAKIARETLPGFEIQDLIESLNKVSPEQN